MAVNEAAVQDFAMRAMGDIGAALTASLVVIGDKLGLYRAMTAGPATPAELAKRTETSERYVREWLNGQAAAGYVEYDPATGRYTLPEANAVCLADDESPACVLGGFQGMTAAMRAAPRIAEAFRSGEGVGWHEHDPAALDGVREKLERGARVADVGCGHGASTIIMGKAFPRSTFVGFDYHQPSIDAARERARRAGLNGSVAFETAAAKAFPGKDYDLVTCFDCLHDMGDPVGAARHVCESLAPDGTMMLVEPFAHDEVERNLNPIGRLFYSVSTLVCTPGSLSQEVGAALGAQAGEKRLRSVLKEAGFTRVRRATETPFNLVIEARR